MQIGDLLEFKHWMVVGDVLNPDKFAYTIVDGLSKAGYHVVKVNPRDKTGAVYTEVEAVEEPVEVLDLVINPSLAMEIMRKAHNKGINKVIAQPGAESQELREYCQLNGIYYFEGCALKELNKKGL